MLWLTDLISYTKFYHKKCVYSKPEIYQDFKNISRIKHFFVHVYFEALRLSTVILGDVKPQYFLPNTGNLILFTC